MLITCLFFLLYHQHNTVIAATTATAITTNTNTITDCMNFTLTVDWGRIGTGIGKINNLNKIKFALAFFYVHVNVFALVNRV